MRDRDEQPDAREGQAGRVGVAERPVIPMKPGNAGLIFLIFSSLREITNEFESDGGSENIVPGAG